MYFIIHLSLLSSTPVRVVSPSALPLPTFRHVCGAGGELRADQPTRQRAQQTTTESRPIHRVTSPPETASVHTHTHTHTRTRARTCELRANDGRGSGERLHEKVQKFIMQLFPRSKCRTRSWRHIHLITVRVAIIAYHVQLQPLSLS